MSANTEVKREEERERERERERQRMNIVIWDLLKFQTQMLHVLSMKKLQLL